MKFESPNFSIIKNDNQLKTVEFCARLCYKSMDKLTEDSYIKFCKARFAEKHYAIFEHANFLFKMNVDKQNNLLNMLHEFKNLYGVTYDFRFAHEEPTIDPETNELHMKLCEECVFVLNLRHVFELADAGDFRFYNALPEEYHIFYSEEDLKKHDKRFDSMWSFDFVDEKINDDKFNFVTVAFDCQRSVWDELARHRKNGLCCESSRYCVAGDTQIFPKCIHNTIKTIEELYNNKISSKNGAWKKMSIKQVNEKTGQVQYSKIKDVFFNGKKECFKIKTRLGYSLKCTGDHLIYTDKGFIKLNSLNEGDRVYINGKMLSSNLLYQDYDWMYYQFVTLKKSKKQISEEFGFSESVLSKWKSVLKIPYENLNKDELYKHYDWFYEQYITQNKTCVDIANEFNFNVSTLKKWKRILNLPSKPASYFNVGRIPWNKGVREKDSESVKIQADTLRKYHWDSINGKRTHKKVNAIKYRQYAKDSCELCGSTKTLQVHHLDRDNKHSNNYPDNLITLCSSCHQRLHYNNLPFIHLDEIVEIKKVGLLNVYDIEMDSDFHNFSANGIIVHNCQYSKGKFGGEITYSKPSWVEDEHDATYQELQSICKNAEDGYMKLTEMGLKAQDARFVLPLGYRVNCVVTASIEQWKHIFELRTSKAAHPDIAAIMSELKSEFERLNIS